ncbi:MAG: SagB/ThcOx family dehydrogenase [Bryobacterales bacterium]|nr:SagB/ThcOx family dehydrogenase [Bryobacteraceae bacterium]MDW8130468.1 SagB/ThcOx family dehydrogenase [Bryobacterales bacterium]
MKERSAWLVPVLVVAAACAQGQEIRLPPPVQDGKVSLEKCLVARRSVRSFRDEAVKLAEVSQLLWAAQGITGGQRLRTAPSAGALYPLELYLLAGKVEGLPPGVYKYRPEGHGLVRLAHEDRRAALAEAALGQQFVAQAPAVFVIAGVYERTAKRYGDRAPRYVHIEVGHAGQNLCLQAVALGLGSVPVGAFRDPEVKRVTGMAEDEAPLYILPVGRPQREQR